MRASIFSKRWVIQGLTILALVLLWEVVARSGVLFEGLFPSFVKIMEEVWRHVAGVILLPHLAATFYEVGVGFAVGTFLGVPLGLIMGRNKYLGQVFEPFILYLAAVPKIIFFPIFLMFFGIGLNSKVAMGASSAFFPIVINTVTAAREVSPVYLKVAESLGARPLQMYAKVYLPAMMGAIFVGLRLGMGVAVVGSLLAETKLANAGLGFLVTNYYSEFRIPEMYSIILLIFVIAAVLNWVMSAFQPRRT